LKRLICYSLLCGSIYYGSCQQETPKKDEAAITMIKYPEKGEMLLLTDRPPQLETPLKIFRQDITPNEYFFVRWHLSQLVTKIDIDTFRLYINGSVEKPLALSLNDLKTKFTPDSIIALAICAGNSRSTFNPKVPGTQWRNGAMGNAKWKGVRLKDILAMAGVKGDAVDVSFQGMDRGALPGIPPFVKSLDIRHAMESEIIVAYEMNGKPLPMLNGYPLKLVVPGWYATFWVSAMNSIVVHPDTFHGFWMDKAYQITTDSLLNELPASLAKKTRPLTNINMHSIFVKPETGETLPKGKPYTVEGLVFNDGTGISKVELSLDGGKTWTATTLNPEIAKYSWRRWKYEWTPSSKGDYDLAVRATDTRGRTQTTTQWNRSGYGRGFIEHIDVKVN
jgi:sulfite dehydrogenase